MLRKLVLWSVLVGFSTVFLVSCIKPQPDELSSDPATLPLLGDRKVHLYVQEAFEDFPDDVVQAVDNRYAELVAAGMDNARHLFDWGMLEPTPGEYEVQHVVEAMDARLARGITHQFCNISVLDSFGPESIPPYINDLLEKGTPWDDPQIVGAFTKMLDAVVPVMVQRRMYMIGFSNEPGGYYENDPEGAASFAGFIEAAIEHTHSIQPDLACTVVFAGPNDMAIPNLMPLVDVASFNQYAYESQSDPTCTFNGLPSSLYRASLPVTIGGLLDDLIDVAQGKLICIQEFGQSTGWGDVPDSIGPNASLENQRAVIQALAEALDARRSQFRTVCIWTLNDHTPSGMQYLANSLLDEGLPQCFADNLTEIFGPTGLVRSDATASTKPAFEECKNAISHLSTMPE